MDRSLSVVLPVYNAQFQLMGQVRRLLELLPELASRFEIVIVDDASSDQTDEVAHELALQYSQVRVVRHLHRQGQSVTAQTGVRNATGDIIYVQAENEPISEADIRRLVDSMSQRVDIENVEPKPLDAGIIQRLINWGAELKRAHDDSSRKEMAGPKYVKNSDEDGFTIPTRRRKSTAR